MITSSSFPSEIEREIDLVAELVEHLVALVRRVLEGAATVGAEEATQV